MQINLIDIFPELKKQLTLQASDISAEDLEKNHYFNDLVNQILDDSNEIKQSNKNRIEKHFFMKQNEQIKDLKSMISKCIKKVKIVKVKKGTVIYTTGMPPEDGYLILHGYVELLTKKTARQKLQNFPEHTCFKQSERLQFLNNRFNIQPDIAKKLQNLFFEEQILFNFLSFRTLFAKDYFGFKEMIRGSLRNKTAIAVEETTLIKFPKLIFDKHLKEFEQSRQLYILNNMLMSTRKQIADEILPKILQTFNSAQIIKLEKGEKIFRQTEYNDGIYFILDGQVSLSKQVKIQISKKFLSNQNKGDLTKLINVSLMKMGKNTFLGDIEIIRSQKYRLFSAEASLNGTLLLKMEASSFLKSIAQSTQYERELTLSVKSKYESLKQIYEKQKKTLVKAYDTQISQHENKKKQKKLINLLHDENNFKKKQLYELFKKQGMFYRDSFERLEGFDNFQAKYDPKRGEINRHKMMNLNSQKASSNDKKIHLKAKQLLPVNMVKPIDYDLETTEKILMSPKRTANQFQVIADDLKIKQSPQSEHTAADSSKLKRKKRLFSKFKELKKDQSIYKRVLIKNGLYEINRQTNKSNMIKSIVNHQFDEIVKQTMTRKNLALRKALIEQKEEIFKECYEQSIQNLKSKSVSLTKFTNFTTMCRGTEEMKKKMQKFKSHKKIQGTQSQKSNQDFNALQSCIGFNKQPASSQAKNRSEIFPFSTKINSSPQKIVLLNHMMKPITYCSTQML